MYFCQGEKMHTYTPVCCGLFELQSNNHHCSFWFWDFYTFVTPSSKWIILHVHVDWMVWPDLLIFAHSLKTRLFTSFSIKMFCHMECQVNRENLKDKGDFSKNCGLRSWCVAQQDTCCMRHQHPIWCQFVSKLFHFRSSCLLMAWKKQQEMAQCLGPCHMYGKPA